VAEEINTDQNIAAKYEIVAFTDGQVAINGPIKNFPFTVEVLNGALTAVIQFHRQKDKIKAPSNNIIVPKMAGFKQSRN